MQRRLVFVLSMLAIGVTPWVAAAQPEQEARALYVSGDAAYAEGRYEAALALFEEAYRISERPALLYNIANTLERLGRTSDAIERLRSYLPHAPADLRSTVEVRIRSLETRAAREAERQRAQASTERDLPPPATEFDREPDTTSTEAAASASQPDTTPWGPIVLYSLAGLATAVAVPLVVHAGSLDDSARESCRVVEGTGTLCPAAARGVVSDAQAFALTGDILFGIAGASLVSAIVWTVAGASAGPATEERAALWVAPAGAGMQLGGEF